jgi:hypothetical protein
MANRILLYVIPLLFFACEKDARIPLPESQSKLVLVSFISPDVDTLEASLTWSAPVFRSSQKFPSDPSKSVVWLEGPSGKHAFQYSTSKEKFVLLQEEAALDYGKTYQIFAKDPEGNMVHGTCEIPLNQANGFEVMIEDSFETGGSWGAPIYTYLFRIRFADSGSGISRFRVGAYQEVEFEEDKPFWYALDGEMETRFYESEANPPRNFSLSVRPSSFSSSSGSNGSQKFRFTLTKGDEAYYQYHRSLFSFEGDNPFAEPVRLYSNVQGGLGVVAGFSMQQLEIEK